MPFPRCLDARGVPVHLFFSDSCWIEGVALDQLGRAAALPGMVRAAAFPDLHPGRGIPVGAAFLCSDRIYPHLIGNDLGCGIGLWQTELEATRPKLDRWVRRLEALEPPDSAFGTVGGGNHFAELTRVAKVHDAPGLEAMGVRPRQLLVLVHTGSRGLGETIFRHHAAQHGGEALPAGSEAARAYLERHDEALQWAEANRAQVACRMGQALGTDLIRLCDAFHNLIEPAPEGWIHRKGAAQADRGPLVIAGSRGTPSVLVQPVGEDPACLRSLAHGAGRRWQRREVRSRLSDRIRPEQLLHTELGGRVICPDKDLLYEEAPQAYKDIHRVLEELVSLGHVRVLAELAPLITWKA